VTLEEKAKSQGRDSARLENRPLRLNLGCGLLTHPKWVNVDGSWNARLARHPFLRKTLAGLNLLTPDKAGVPWSREILIHDIRKPLPFPDSSAEAVYASHVLEHLYREQGQQLIAECFRVLMKGGIIRVVVPDLRAIVNEYVGEKWTGETTQAQNGSPPADVFNERLLMRSSSPPKGNVLARIYEAWQDFHSHKWMYDEQSLAHLLRSGGFTDVIRRDYGESEIEGITDVEDPSRILNGGGVCVEARKP